VRAVYQPKHGLAAYRFVVSDSGKFRLAQPGDTPDGIVSSISDGDRFNVETTGEAKLSKASLSPGTSYGVGTDGVLDSGASPTYAKATATDTVLLQQGPGTANGGSGAGGGAGGTTVITTDDITDMSAFGRAFVKRINAPDAKTQLELKGLKTDIPNNTATLHAGLSADHTYNLPDQDGTVALLEREQTFTKRQHIQGFVPTGVNPDTVSIGGGEIYAGYGVRSFGGPVVPSAIGGDSRPGTFVLQPPPTGWPTGGMHMVWADINGNLKAHLGINDSAMTSVDFSCDVVDDGMYLYTKQAGTPSLLTHFGQYENVRGVAAPTASSGEVNIGGGKVEAGTEVRVGTTGNANDPTITPTAVVTPQLQLADTTGVHFTATLPSSVSYISVLSDRWFSYTAANVPPDTNLFDRNMVGFGAGIGAFGNKIQLHRTLGGSSSWSNIVSAATDSRTNTVPDKDGTFAMTSDVHNMPTGGTAGQALEKIDGTDYNTQWVTLPTVHNMPTGGTTGQALTKIDGTDYNTQWSTIVNHDPPTGGTAGQVLAKIDGTDYNWQWVNQSGGSISGGNTDYLVRWLSATTIGYGVSQDNGLRFKVAGTDPGLNTTTGTVTIAGGAVRAYNGLSINGADTVTGASHTSIDFAGGYARFIGWGPDASTLGKIQFTLSQSGASAAKSVMTVESENVYVNGIVPAVMPASTQVRIGGGEVVAGLGHVVNGAVTTAAANLGFVDYSTSGLRLASFGPDASTKGVFSLVLATGSATPTTIVPYSVTNTGSNVFAGSDAGSVAASKVSIGGGVLRTAGAAYIDGTDPGAPTSARVTIGGGVLRTGGLFYAGGKASFYASTAAGSSINIAPGVAPTTKYDGDIWATATGGLFHQVNGATIQYTVCSAAMVPVVQSATAALARVAMGPWNDVGVLGMINAMDPTYGAKFDGTTDDTLAIQSVLTAGAGQVVVFPSGRTGVITSPIFVPSNTIIMAYGCTIFCKSTMDLSKCAFVFSDATFTVGIHDTKCFGLTIDGNRANRATGSRGGALFYISGSYRILLQDCLAINSHQEGFQVSGDTGWAGGLSKNCKTINCKSDTAYRNGLSISGTENFVDINGEYHHTAGAAPQAGVDIEPNGATSKNLNFQFIGTCAHDNTANGLQVTASSAGKNTGTISGVSASNNGTYGVTSDAPIDQVRLSNIVGYSNTTALVGGGYAVDDSIMTSRILQTVRVRVAGPQTISASVFTDVTSATISVTPRYANSTIRLHVRCVYESVTIAAQTDLEAHIRLVNVAAPTVALDLVYTRNSGASGTIRLSGSAVLNYDHIYGSLTPVSYKVQAAYFTGGSGISISQVELIAEEIAIG